MCVIKPTMWPAHLLHGTYSGAIGTIKRTGDARPKARDEKQGRQPNSRLVACVCSERAF